MTYIMQFDGLFRRFSEERYPTEPSGLLCFGWLVSRDEIIIAQGHGVFARHKGASSNVAEYLALIEGLDAMGDMGLENETIRVSGDAKSVIDQMLGYSSVNSETIRPLYTRARQLAKGFDHIQWVWTPRKYNRAADWLSRRAMRQFSSDRRTYQAVLKAAKKNSGRFRSSTRLLPLIDLRIYQPFSQIELPSRRSAFLPVF